MTVGSIALVTEEITHSNGALSRAKLWTSLILLLWNVLRTHKTKKNKNFSMEIRELRFHDSEVKKQFESSELEYW